MCSWDSSLETTSTAGLYFQHALAVSGYARMLLHLKQYAQFKCSRSVVPHDVPARATRTVLLVPGVGRMSTAASPQNHKTEREREREREGGSERESERGSERERERERDTMWIACVCVCVATTCTPSQKESLPGSSCSMR